MNSNMHPKSCGLTAELLVRYADGELSAADARRVADHLADCARCRAELELLGEYPVLKLGMTQAALDSGGGLLGGMCRRIVAGGRPVALLPLGVLQPGQHT